MKALADLFLAAKQRTLRAATLKDYGMVLNGTYFGVWMSRPATSITRRDILDAYTSLGAAHGNGMANKAMRVLSSLLNYGKATVPAMEGWPNPVAVLSETRSRLALKPRTGHIPLESLSRWLAAVDWYAAEARSDIESSRRRDFRFLVMLLLMTGLRSNEGRSLRWSAIDLNHQALTIASDTAKNGLEAVLPINNWIMSKLSERDKTESPFVFAAERNGYIRNLRRPFKAVSTRSGLDITPHDLRRTFATYLDATGAPFGAIKQLLNHSTSSDVTARYIQNRGLGELRRYSDKVLDLLVAAGLT